MEERKYIPVSEVAENMGIKRTSLYYYIKKLRVTVHHFPLNRHGFITLADAGRIRTAKDSPWELGDRQQGKAEAVA